MDTQSNLEGKKVRPTEASKQLQEKQETWEIVLLKEMFVQAGNG
jgi:hypothetical protein